MISVFFFFSPWYLECWSKYPVHALIILGYIARRGMVGVAVQVCFIDQSPGCFLWLPLPFMLVRDGAGFLYTLVAVVSVRPLHCRCPRESEVLCSSCSVHLHHDYLWLSSCMLIGDWLLISGEMTSTFCPFENDRLLLLSCKSLNVRDISSSLFIGFSDIFFHFVGFLFCFIHGVFATQEFWICSRLIHLSWSVPCLKTPV